MANAFHRDQGTMDSMVSPKCITIDNRKIKCVCLIVVVLSLAAATSHANEMHPDMVGKKRCITMEALLRTDPGLRQIGLYRARNSSEIKSSQWSVGCETLDREYADFDKYKDYVGQTGAKRGRLFSGWAKCEKEKGKYDFAWLDHQVRSLAAMGVKPWICLSYGNPVYGSGINLGEGVAGVVWNPEAFDAWLRYCGEVVKRYVDVVEEWEVWNEPFGNQMDVYCEMIVKTADVIHSIQPNGKVMVSAVGDVENTKDLLRRIREAGRIDCVSCWLTHPYIHNPDEVGHPYWGIDATTGFRKLLGEVNPKFLLAQGEVGCPGQLEFGHALSLRPWTEYSQAKWELRSMATYAVRGIPYNVFSMVDLQYEGYMLQSFGLLRMDLGKNVVYARPKYFACRNMFSFFDSDVKPIGPESASFDVLERRIPQADLPSCDEPKTSDVPYSVAAAHFEKAGTPVLLVWYSHRIPSDALVFDTVRLSVPGVAFSDPVWMDMITGRVYEIDRKDVKTRDETTEFGRLPLWDSPVLLAERAQVELCR